MKNLGKFDKETDVRQKRRLMPPPISLPGPLCSRVRPDVRDKATDVRQNHRLMPPPISLPRLLYSRVKPDVRDRRQTRRTKASLNAST